MEAFAPTVLPVKRQCTKTEQAEREAGEGAISGPVQDS
jgi:hypothetical protein